MKGVAKQTESIIEKISLLESIKGWTLVGGTALAIQLDHRKSEDLDFMKWLPSKDEKLEIDWPKIKKDLETIGEIQSMDILDFNHVEFRVSDVKISFYMRRGKSPVKSSIPFLNNIFLADTEAIAAMKLEVMLRRSKFRDYYDLFFIFKQDPDIMKFIKAAGEYSNHQLKSKNILSLLTNHNRFSEDSNFPQLEPKLSISPLEIEEYIKKLIESNR